MEILKSAQQQDFSTWLSALYIKKDFCIV